MDNTKTWTVVQFQEDDTVEAVPSCWIEGEQCLWPPYIQEKTTIAIKNCEINTHWASYKVRIFKNATYDDYALARAKAKRAEMTSDLNSDKDDSKRKTKKPKPFISSSSSDSDMERSRKQLPTPPRRNLQKKDLEKTFTETPCSRKEPAINTSFSRASSFGSLRGTELLNCNNSCICCQRENTINKTLFVIKNITCDILERVQQLSVSGATKNEEVPILAQAEISYPISSLEDLNRFEIFFKNEDNYNSLVRMFSKIGGANCSEFIKRCLTPVLSDKMAEKYSFIGRKQKDNFSVLSLSRSILDAADKMPIIKDRKECENAIAAWLKRAKARMDRKMEVINRS